MKLLAPLLVIAALLLCAACSGGPRGDTSQRQLVNKHNDLATLMRQRDERERARLHAQWERIQREGARKLAEREARRREVQRQRELSARRNFQAVR